MINYVQLAFLLSILLVGGGIWWRGIRRLGLGHPPLENRLRDPSPIGLVDVLLMFGSWIVAQTVGIGLLQLSGIDVFNPDNLSTEDKSMLMIVISGTQLLVTILCLIFYFIRYRACSSIGWHRGFGMVDLKTGLIWFFVIVPPVLMIQIAMSRLVPYKHDTLETLKSADSAMPILATWFSAVLVAPVIEEIFFRGILQNWMQRLGQTEPETFGKLIFGGYSDPNEKFILDRSGKPVAESSGDSHGIENPYRSPAIPSEECPNEKSKLEENDQVFFDSNLRWLPIFISALMFAASHLGQGAAPVPLFFLAVGLGYLYRQTGSILPCILVHVLLNFQTMFWVTIAVVAS